jgi:hypothetical protein
VVRLSITPNTDCFAPQRVVLGFVGSAANPLAPLAAK